MSLVDLGKRLLEAAKQGCMEEVRTLMSNGAPFTTDWLGTSPLHFAALNGHASTAEVLLRAGISRDARTKVDRTPLHVAAQEGHANIVDLLIRNGADIEAKDMLKMTPLHWAVEKGHITVIELLISSGADIDCQNKFEKSCIDIAHGNGRTDIGEILQLSRSNNVEHMTATSHAVEQVLEEVTEVNEVQPEITIQDEVEEENIISAEAAEGDTFVVDSAEAEARGGYYLTDGSGVAVSEEGGEHNTQVLATLAALAEATAPRTTTPTSNATDVETLKWLESQGITMISADNSTLVANTLDNGQHLTLTEAGKLALKQIVQTKKEDGEEEEDGTHESLETLQAVPEGRMLTIVDGQMVVADHDGNTDNSMVVTLQSDGTILRDEASGEPPLKRIKTEESDNGLIIQQETLEEEEEVYTENVTFKPEPE